MCLLNVRQEKWVSIQLRKRRFLLKICEVLENGYFLRNISQRSHDKLKKKEQIKNVMKASSTAR